MPLKLSGLIRPALVLATLVWTTAPAARASGTAYNVTNLGIRDAVGLNDAGQVALNQSTSFGYYDPIYDGNSASARHTSQSSFTHALLYNGYGPDAGGMTFVGQALPAATGDPSGLNSVTTINGKVIAKPETSDIATGLDASGRVLVTSAAGSFLTDGKTYLSAPPVLPAFPGLPIGLLPPNADAMKVLDAHGVTSFTGYGVNSRGMVVGTDGTPILTSSGIYYGYNSGYGYSGRAILFDGVKAVDLNTMIGDHLNLTLEKAIAINSNGQILAVGRGGSNFVQNAFLLTPVDQPVPVTPTLAPEPGTLAILGLAAGAAWLRRRATGRKMAVPVDETR